jgi:hypothetical protein
MNPVDKSGRLGGMTVIVLVQAVFWPETGNRSLRITAGRNGALWISERQRGSMFQRNCSTVTLMWKIG